MIFCFAFTPVNLIIFSELKTIKEEMIMVEERYARQWGLIDVERLHEVPIKIIGTGSVGSFIALSLAKMGAQTIETWDDDIVNEVNISNQFYRLEDVGEYKVDALQGLIKAFEKVNIIANPEKCNGSEGLEGIVIVALDSMTPRKRIWDAIKGKDEVELFIDPRMGGRTARIYAVNPKTGIEQYEKTLYHDDESTPEKCTERTIIYNVLGISSFVCKLIEDHFKKKTVGCKEIILDYATYTLSVTK